MTFGGDKTIYVFDWETYSEKSQIENVETLIKRALDVVIEEYQQGTTSVEPSD